MKPYVSDIRFKNPQGSEVATLAGIIRGGTSLGIEEMTVDSLILTGSYFLMDQSLDRVNCILKIQDIRAVKLYQSEEFTIHANDCPPAIQRAIFNKLLNKESYGEIEYKGYVIDKLERLFNAGDNDLLLPPAVYSFVNRHPYAIQYQVNALKEILTLKYGVSFSQDSNNKIVIPADGSLIFIRDGKERPLQKIIDGEPLYSNDFSSQCSSYFYMSSSMENSGKTKKMEEKKFSTSNEVKIRDKIFETFNIYYPAIFNPFDYEKLNTIFSIKRAFHSCRYCHSSDPTTGKEIVTYRWQTKQAWLDHLKTCRG